MVTLSQVRDGAKGKITAINGGFGMMKKLDALGIRIGSEITKVSGQWMKGPVIIRSGNTEIGIGYGMAGKIILEEINENTSYRKS